VSNNESRDIVEKTEKILERIIVNKVIQKEKASTIISTIEA